MSFSLPVLSIIKFQYSLDFLRFLFSFENSFTDACFILPIFILSVSPFHLSKFLLFHSSFLVFIIPVPVPSFCFQVFRFHGACLTFFFAVPLPEAPSSRCESEPVNRSSGFLVRYFLLPILSNSRSHSKKSLLKNSTQKYLQNPLKKNFFKTLNG